MGRLLAEFLTFTTPKSVFRGYRLQDDVSGDATNVFVTSIVCHVLRGKEDAKKCGRIKCAWNVRKNYPACDPASRMVSLTSSP